MYNLISININKRLSFLSMIFMFVSSTLLISLIYFYASFDLSFFQVLNNYELVFCNFLEESTQIIELITILFIMLLVMMELFYNINNFDSYFISLSNKKTYFYAKIISYLILLFLYISITFLSVFIIYYLRFKSISEFSFLFRIYIYYLIYFVTIFLISYFILLIFRNYFSMIIIFLIYWISKIIESEKFNRYFFLSLKINYEKRSVNFSFNKFYLTMYIIILFLFCFKTYVKKDIKINS